MPTNLSARSKKFSTRAVCITEASTNPVCSKFGCRTFETTQGSISTKCACGETKENQKQDHTKQTSAIYSFIYFLSYLRTSSADCFYSNGSCTAVQIQPPPRTKRRWTTTSCLKKEPRGFRISLEMFITQKKVKSLIYYLENPKSCTFDNFHHRSNIHSLKRKQLLSFGRSSKNLEQLHTLRLIKQHKPLNAFKTPTNK